MEYYLPETLLVTLNDKPSRVNGPLDLHWQSSLNCPSRASMCIKCLKYRIVLLIVIKNPWVHGLILLTLYFAPGHRPVPRWSAYLSDPQLVCSPFDIPHPSASTVSPSSD